MYISLNWLSRYVDLDDLDPLKIALDLTMATAETESVTRFAAALDDVVVAEVVACERHPDADRLSRTLVADGSGETFQVVCGAPNVAKGQKVALARVGTNLPGGLKIKKSKIRGVESFGMLCSEQELELAPTSEGILVLPESAQVGARVSDGGLVGVADWVIEIDNKSITHRPDLWGHYGFARELAAIYRRPLRPLGGADRAAHGSGTSVPVTIEDACGCTRYLALPMDGIAVGPSPAWMRYLLAAVGQRSISNIVDLSNFVMLETGQPNHTFDAAKLRGGRIAVRRAKAGETMHTLDDVERRFTVEDLLICDGGGPVAVAGVMGGRDSEIGDDASALVLEVAHFDPVRVRTTAQRIGLRTDASARFEKSLDPCGVETAAWRFVELLQEICPTAHVTAQVTDVGDWTKPSAKIPLRRRVVESRLGMAMSTEQIADYLERLGFGLERRGDDLEVDVPSFRATKDIGIEVDLVEEVGRMLGYDNIPEQAPTMPVVPPPHDAERMLKRKVQDVLARSLGYAETLNYSFLGDDVIEALGVDPAAFVEVTNPIAQGASRMRREVLPSLLAPAREALRETDDLRVFEVGKGYERERLEARDMPHERLWVGALWALRGGSDTGFSEPTYERVKGSVEELLFQVDAGRVTYRRASDDERPAWAHPGKCAAIVRDERHVIGVVAEVDPRLVRRLEIEGATLGAFQLDLRALLEHREPVARHRRVPAYPGVHFDVAVAVPNAITVSELEAEIRQIAPDQVREVTLFDVYRGEKLGADRKSLGFRIVLQAMDRTLTDKDLARYLNKLDGRLVQRGFTLRRT